MEVTGRALNRYNAWAAIRKRAKAAGFLTPVGCHTWRATGITIYLENDGRLEHAQQMAGHESPRTTKLYDRTKDEITLSEVESGCDAYSSDVLLFVSCGDSKAAKA
jgi:integrase/recombinase XerD